MTIPISFGIRHKAQYLELRSLFKQIDQWGYKINTSDLNKTFDGNDDTLQDLSQRTIDLLKTIFSENSASILEVVHYIRSLFPAKNLALKQSPIIDTTSQESSRTVEYRESDPQESQHDLKKQIEDMWLSMYSVPSIKERKNGLPTNMKTYLAHSGILVQE